MALAKVGSVRRWSTICGDLHLPASHAQRVERLLRYLRRSGLWPEVLVGLERLMAGLQQHPPPIDYPARRTLGDDLELLDEAIRAGCQVHPSLAPTETLVQQFWERFTGGDIAYAPARIRIDPNTPAYRAFRALLGVGNSDLFHVAHRHLTRTANVDGPLTWRPGPLPTTE